MTASCWARFGEAMQRPWFFPVMEFLWMIGSADYASMCKMAGHKFAGGTDLGIISFLGTLHICLWYL
jgi:hypothetical protein